MPGFDPQLAAQGRDLHAHILSQETVHDCYLLGTLSGAATPEPKASIMVPLDAWKTLNDADRLGLMHYAASLVEPMRKNPFAYCQIPATAPAADMVRKNAGKMGPRSWVIYGGLLDGSDILTDEALASGADNPLGPKPDIATPEELMSQLRAAGLRSDSPWHRSNFDGIWNAVLRSTFGDNEVSCLVESSSSRTVEFLELEAEIHRPGQREADLFSAFARAALAICKEPGLLQAIEAKADWTSGKWRLAREPSPSDGNYVLSLVYR